jgi:type II secretory pathway pseudopilin PulG
VFVSGLVPDGLEADKPFARLDRRSSHACVVPMQLMMSASPTHGLKLPACLRGHGRLRNRFRGEVAMTLIELIVAMVLLGIAGAVVFGVLIQGLSGSSNARAGGISDAAINRTSDAMSDDIARALTEDSRAGSVRDELNFAAAVRRNETAWRASQDAAGRIDVNAPPEAADIDDVRVATPTSFQIIVGDTCVTWTAAPGTNDGRATFDIVRAEAPSTNCAASTDTKRFISAEPTAPGLDTTPFSYKLVCNPSVCPGSAAPATAPCRPFVVDSVSPAQRRWIVGIEARIASLTNANRGVGAAQASVSQEIRGRGIESYREALGC